MTCYFSIIIPMYNRQAHIGRAIASCLSQDFSDYEVIVVDDASTDESARVVNDFSDHRVMLIRHDINRGVCPARNTGIKIAHGDWIICLDSDDELTPNALTVAHEETNNAEPFVSSIRFMCQYDSGAISPDPPFGGEILDYKSYIEWLWNPNIANKESLICVRRTTFETVKYPDNRSLETAYHLDFAKHFISINCSRVIRLYHQDAANSFCFSPSPETWLRNASDQAINADSILATHGDALKKWSADGYKEIMTSAITQYLLAGYRYHGWKRFLNYINTFPLSRKVLSVLMFGLIHRRFLAHAKGIHHRHHLKKQPRAG